MNMEFKAGAKLHGVSYSDLAGELEVSEDRVTAMSNNPEGTPLGRIIASFDYMGGSPAELVLSISNNRFALDGLEDSGAEFVSTRDKLGSVIGEYSGCSANGVKSIADAFEKIYRYPILYICGEYASGKLTMAENLIGTELRFAGPETARAYDSLLLMSDRLSEVRYNYPFGQYPYRILSAETVPELLTKPNTESLVLEKLEPAARSGMSGGSYAVYCDSPALSALNIVCGNAADTFPDSRDASPAAEAGAGIISIADVIIVMLSGGAPSHKWLGQLLLCGWEKWKGNLSEHMLFVIPRSDRYTAGEIAELRQSRAGMLKELAERVIGAENAGSLGGFSNMVFSYSSIYKKNNDKDKSDASRNWDFYQKLHSALLAASDDGVRRSAMSAVLRDMRRVLLPENSLSNESAASLKLEIRRVCSGAENDFIREFSGKYDEMINENNIVKLISRNDITRNREDRQRLVSIVNSSLMNAAKSAARDAVTKMLDELADMTAAGAAAGAAVGAAVGAAAAGLIASADPGRNVTDAAIGTEKETAWSPDNNKEPSKKISAAAMFMLTRTLVVPLSIFAAAAVAGAMASSYYAQTNFEKNTAKKLVSAYNSQGVKEKITRNIISEYFVPLRENLLRAAENSRNKDDDVTPELIGRLLQIIE